MCFLYEGMYRRDTSVLIRIVSCLIDPKMAHHSQDMCVAWTINAKLMLIYQYCEATSEVEAETIKNNLLFLLFWLKMRYQQLCLRQHYVAGRGHSKQLSPFSAVSHNTLRTWRGIVHCVYGFCSSNQLIYHLTAYILGLRT